MFFSPQQASTNTSLMAPRIAGDSPANPILGFSVCSSPHLDRSSDANLAHFNDPGLCIFSSPLGNILEIPKSRKRVREEHWRIPAETDAGVRSPAGCLGEIQRRRSLGGDVAVRVMEREMEEVEALLLTQTWKMRAEMEEKRRNSWNQIFCVVEQSMHRILRHKDEEIAKMGRRNAELIEEVKRLLLEGNNWKSLAETNEATLWSLRRDLATAQAREDKEENGEIEDAESYCYCESPVKRQNCHGCSRNEISVLVLPCRHLCLCSECDSRFVACPLCMTVKTASIKVHMS